MICSARLMTGGSTIAPSTFTAPPVADAVAARMVRGHAISSAPGREGLARAGNLRRMNEKLAAHPESTGMAAITGKGFGIVDGVGHTIERRRPVCRARRHNEERAGQKQALTHMIGADVGCAIDGAEIDGAERQPRGGFGNGIDVTLPPGTPSV